MALNGQKGIRVSQSGHGMPGWEGRVHMEAGNESVWRRCRHVSGPCLCTSTNAIEPVAETHPFRKESLVSVRKYADVPEGSIPVCRVMWAFAFERA